MKIKDLIKAGVIKEDRNAIPNMYVMVTDAQSGEIIYDPFILFDRPEIDTCGEMKIVSILGDAKVLHEGGDTTIIPFLNIKAKKPDAADPLMESSDTKAKPLIRLQDLTGKMDTRYHFDGSLIQGFFIVVDEVEEEEVFERAFMEMTTYRRKKLGKYYEYQVSKIRPYIFDNPVSYKGGNKHGSVLIFIRRPQEEASFRQ